MVGGFSRGRSGHPKRLGQRGGTPTCSVMLRRPLATGLFCITLIGQMRIAYDPAKNAQNIARRGLSFDDVTALDWSKAILRRDARRDYGENRTRAWLMGPDGKPYAVVFTVRGKVTWIISFRRAHAKVWRRYAKKEA